MKIFYNFLALIFIFPCYIFAQQVKDTNVILQNIADTTLLNTTQQDTLKKDTNTYYSFSNYKGSFLELNDEIIYNDIPTKNYFFITDILTQSYSTNPLFTTIAGNHSDFSFLSAMPTENICMLAGINMSDFYGNSNLDYISPEFANSIEILYGSKAAIKTGKSGVAVNIQPFIYNTKKPYSKIWYSQGDNKLIGVDGIYSQNFLPNWNITTGFKRVSSNSYYQNSFIDMWNARLMLSFQQSNQSAFSLLYHFTNFYTGDFGGILIDDYNKNNNSANQVRVNFTTLSDRQYKSDLILSHSYNLHDTTLIVNSNLFLNHLENDIYYRTDSVFWILDSSGRNRSFVYNYGLNTNLKYKLLNLFYINSGLEINSNNVPKTLLTKNFKGFGYNIYTYGTLNLSNIDISLGGRYGKQYDKNIFSFGTNVTDSIAKKISIVTDVSYLKTAPIPIFNNLQETHLLGILGINYDSIFNINLFYRNIKDQILLINTTNIPLFSTINSNSLFGGTIKSKIKLPYNFTTILLFSDYLDKNADNSNCFYANLSLEYTYTKNLSSITGGVSGTLLQSENKYYFSPIIKNYIRTNLNEGVEFDGISLYVKAKLGNCYLRMNFKNILGLNYSYLAYYPMLKQEFCLSLTWAFP